MPSLPWIHSDDKFPRIGSISMFNKSLDFLTTGAARSCSLSGRHCVAVGMAKDAARVARIVNETVAEGRNSLDLSNCKLTSFPVALFKVMKDVLENIHFISLENNELKSITGDFMTNFNQMRELNLEGNFLKQLPDEVKTLTHLKNINLARNKFSSFPHQLTELTALENINLEANEITEMPLETLSSMPSLKLLNMKLNPLNRETLAVEQIELKFELLVTVE
ncbi:leucine-rich repeat-containing protein 20-like isoform X2 [Mobula birostris]|uniref:leucine-rich repeat-containing protein 20-like isoform X2 n=1 Tax=Mobula birostris TaxID=1983395 RepID=UPI003B287600